MIGELVGPVFIYLQKPTGRLGPRIQRSIYHANNIYVTCSKSGKLTKSHIQYWAEKVLRPSVADDCLLLLDSWSAQTDPSIYDKIFTGNIKCEKLQIPPKTTGDIQPLDRYFFRQWKYFKQRICDRIAIDRMDIDITSRNSILKMNSLIQNQLTARKFSPMIKYSWHSSGYLQNDPSQFENVQEDHELADHLFLLFDQLLNSTELLVDNIVTLDFDYYNDDDDEYQGEDNNEDLTSIDGVTNSYDTMCSIIEYSKTHTFLSLRNRYKNIKSKEQLRRMKRYVDSQGTKVQKLRCIDEFVYAEFIRARESSLSVHDSDVRRLALKKHAA
ncbi:unnamed protein product [Rotaria magnacalcarata]|nr:unnamed protein product [Rotaria magnacalcarata]